MTSTYVEMLAIATSLVPTMLVYLHVFLTQKLLLCRVLWLYFFAAFFRMDIHEYYLFLLTAASLSLQAFWVKNNFHQEEVQDEWLKKIKLLLWSKNLRTEMLHLCVYMLCSAFISQSAKCFISAAMSVCWQDNFLNGDLLLCLWAAFMTFALKAMYYRGQKYPGSASVDQIAFLFKTAENSGSRMHIPNADGSTTDPSK